MRTPIIHDITQYCLRNGVTFDEVVKGHSMKALQVRDGLIRNLRNTGAGKMEIRDYLGVELKHIEEVLYG